MGRKRKANLEIEYALERQVQDLKQENAKLKRRLKELEKTIEESKVEVVEEKKKKHVIKECPNCGAATKVSELPMGYLELCEAACGHRAVRKKGN
jgi:predicted RNase H-like nuclease (RuvC/YqgF family)